MLILVAAVVIIAVAALGAELVRATCQKQLAAPVRVHVTTDRPLARETDSRFE